MDYDIIQYVSSWHYTLNSCLHLKQYLIQSHLTQYIPYSIYHQILAKPQTSAEGVKITVPLNVAKMSKMICDSIGDEDDDEIIDQEFPVPKVSTDILTKVVEFCTHYQTVEKMNCITLPFDDGDDTVLKIIKQKWYADFVKNESLEDFKANNKLIAAANFMNISPLLDLACLSESVYIQGKSAEQLRQLYNIKKPEEKPSVEKEEKTAE